MYCHLPSSGCGDVPFQDRAEEEWSPSKNSNDLSDNTLETQSTRQCSDPSPIHQAPTPHIMIASLENNAIGFDQSARRVEDANVDLCNELETTGTKTAHKSFVGNPILFHYHGPKGAEFVVRLSSTEVQFYLPQWYEHYWEQEQKKSTIAGSRVCLPTHIRECGIVSGSERWEQCLCETD